VNNGWSASWNAPPGFPAGPMPHADGVRTPAWVDPYRPEGYPTWQGFNACLESLSRMLESTLAISDLAPHIHPPFGSRSFFGIRRAVINVPAAFDAAANAAGIALAAANGIAPGSILTPTTVAPPFGPVLFSNHQTPPGFAAIFKSWGMTVENSFPAAARMTIENQGPNTGSAAPSGITSGAAYTDHQPTMVIVPDNRRLDFFVENLDTGSPILVTFSIYGWQIPIRRYEEDLKSLIPQPGYSDDCSGGR
jgi:hypothetical protein